MAGADWPALKRTDCASSISRAADSCIPSRRGGRGSGSLARRTRCPSVTAGVLAADGTAVPHFEPGVASRSNRPIARCNAPRAMSQADRTRRGLRSHTRTDRLVNPRPERTRESESSGDLGRPLASERRAAEDSQRSSRESPGAENPQKPLEKRRRRKRSAPGVAVLTGRLRNSATAVKAPRKEPSS